MVAEKNIQSPQSCKTLPALSYRKGLWSGSRSCHLWEPASEWEAEGLYWGLADLLSRVATNLPFYRSEDRG